MLTAAIRFNVENSLNEDIASGDLTAQLLPAAQTAQARVITREAGVLCGAAWFEQCFLSLDRACVIRWLAKDGENIKPGQTICEISGPSRALLTGERSALNWLQTLSGTATKTKSYVDAVAGLPVKIMDTRKTLPGMREAQKYAVRTGGGHNQRVGLFDGILIKENHIAAAGGIAAVLDQAFRLAEPGVSVQIEVEDLGQMEEALRAGAKLILLDNFDLETLDAAVALNAKRAELEASGGITLATLREVALTGVDRISIGTLTKDVQALDLSMRLVD
ncbi:MAG: carboxylating nicotinate-nucleotide diphosphorylase [Gallionella sp.]|jgi:nicotinate-nucleotide pyrophosphorylase (carboxylating)|nr:carboxylating nicotinate-nucleotide diphosphorylase [Gallionella sp.]NNM80556.1 carboxylating nicotinate-nucleotide diphosphorylase [Gallionella sp.]